MLGATHGALAVPTGIGCTDRATETYQSVDPSSESEPPPLVLGLEPRLTEPESAGLPITPYPIVRAAADDACRAGARERLYCRATRRPTTSGRWRGSNERQIDLCPQHPTGHQISEHRKHGEATHVESSVGPVDPPGSAERGDRCRQPRDQVSKHVIASWAAMPASSPPVRHTRMAASSPNASRSANKARF